MKVFNGYLYQRGERLFPPLPRANKELASFPVWFQIKRVCKEYTEERDFLFCEKMAIYLQALETTFIKHKKNTGAEPPFVVTLCDDHDYSKTIDEDGIDFQMNLNKVFGPAIVSAVQEAFKHYNKYRVDAHNFDVEIMIRDHGMECQSKSKLWNMLSQHLANEAYGIYLENMRRRSAIASTADASVDTATPQKQEEVEETKETASSKLGEFKVSRVEYWTYHYMLYKWLHQAYELLENLVKPHEQTRDAPGAKLTLSNYPTKQEKKASKDPLTEILNEKVKQIYEHTKVAFYASGLHNFMNLPWDEILERYGQFKRILTLRISEAPPDSLDPDVRSFLKQIMEIDIFKGENSDSPIYRLMREAVSQWSNIEFCAPEIFKKGFVEVLLAVDVKIWIYLLRLMTIIDVLQELYKPRNCLAALYKAICKKDKNALDNSKEYLKQAFEYIAVAADQIIE